METVKSNKTIPPTVREVRLLLTGMGGEEKEQKFLTHCYNMIYLPLLRAEKGRKQTNLRNSFIADAIKSLGMASKILFQGAPLSDKDAFFAAVKHCEQKIKINLSDTYWGNELRYKKVVSDVFLYVVEFLINYYRGRNAD